MLSFCVKRHTKFVQNGQYYGVYTKRHRATEHRSSKVTGANPVWKGTNHTTNSESWSPIGNNAV